MVIKNIFQKIRQNELNQKTLIKLYKQPYKLKNYYRPIIPLKIYQTWYTKDLPPKMKENVELLKRCNPAFEHHLFDDNDCREFIKNHFDSDVLNAFDSLIPGAYKADLWRYCVLYINGGIYLDIKLRCINGFKLIELMESNHFTLDRIPPLTIYNACMVTSKENPFLLEAIQQIVSNIKNKFYGKNPLEPTGPGMLGNIILKNKIPINIDLIHYKGGGYIIYKNRFILSTEYPEYYTEQLELFRALNTRNYKILWQQKKIYK